MNIRLILAHSREIECSICLDIIDNQAKQITNCNHVFHANCLAQITNNRCPLCRSALESPEQVIYNNLRESINTLRAESVQINRHRQVTLERLRQEHEEETGFMNQNYDAARNLVDEQFYMRRMASSNIVHLEQAYARYQIDYDSVGHRQAAALEQLIHQHNESHLLLDERHLMRMNAHNNQLDLLLNQFYTHE
jgi:hypothetical protein